MNTDSLSCMLSKKCREQYSKEVNDKINDENEALETLLKPEEEVKEK